MGMPKTISIDCILPGAIAALAAALLSGCEVSASAPPCPYQLTGDHAPSAGCFSVQGGKLLVVQGLNHKLSPPGGGNKSGESAQCTAHRETWEETGLALRPTKLLAVFDTGFHLYRCERLPDSGGIDPPLRFEVRAAFYLAPEEFDKWQWRFPGQQQVLKKLMKGLSESDRKGFE